MAGGVIFPIDHYLCYQNVSVHCNEVDNYKKFCPRIISFRVSFIMKLERQKFEGSNYIFKTDRLLQLNVGTGTWLTEFIPNFPNCAC